MATLVHYIWHEGEGQLLFSMEKMGTWHDLINEKYWTNVLKVYSVLRAEQY